MRPIDPVVTFRNGQGDVARATLVNLQMRVLVMEIYNPTSIVQVSEVLQQLTVRAGEHVIYQGGATVNSMMNTGLMTVASVTLTDAWSDTGANAASGAQMAGEAQHFVQEWQSRRGIAPGYRILISELRSFLSETSRWADQVDLQPHLPRENGRIRDDVFDELARPILEKGHEYFRRLEDEGRALNPGDVPAHSEFARHELHPLLLRAPFVHRTFTKPLGYAGDFGMVNQILGDPRQGDTTYFQLINVMFLSMTCAQAHRNRVAMLAGKLAALAAQAATQGRTLRVLSIACGPAAEVQRFAAAGIHADRLGFTLIDFSEPALDHVRQALAHAGCGPRVEFVQESVHHLLKRTAQDASGPPPAREYDFVYCAGLFDYLSDKTCRKLLEYFAARTRPGGELLATNVHSLNPQRVLMEHLLDWHLIHRDERQVQGLLPARRGDTRIYTDETGINVFAEFRVAADAP